MKIVFVLLAFVFFSNININATTMSNKNNELIISEGIGSEKDLQLENCNLISNNIDWDSSGAYYANYFDLDEKIYFERKVRVTNYDKLDKGMMIYYESLIDEETLDYKIYDIKSYKENNLIVIGSKESGDEIVQTPFPQNYAFIAYYQDGRLLWEKEFTDSYSFISSMVFTKMGILCLLSFETESGANLKIVEFSDDGLILREVEIETDGIDRGLDLYYHNEIIYLICISDATNGDFYFNYEDSAYIAILKIRYETLYLEDYLCLGNKGMNYYKGFAVLDDKMYLIINSTGKEGEFKNNEGGTRGNFMISFPLSLKSYEYVYLDVNGGVESFYVEYNNLIILTNSYFNNQTQVNIYVYDRNLRYLDQYKWKYPEPGIVLFKLDGYVNYLNDAIIILSLQDGVDNEFTGILTQDGYTNFELILYEGKSLNYINAEFASDDSIYIYGYNDEELGYLKTNTIRSQKISSYEVGSKEYIERRIYINEFPLTIMGAKQHNKDFGHYKEKLKLEQAYSTLILIDEYYVDAKINIKDGETYDRGIELDFNGQGNLNDRVINSGSLIDELGKYCLVVDGNSGERKVINFNIADLSLMPVLKEKPHLESNLFEINANTIVPELNVKNYVAITNEDGYEVEAVISFVLITIGIGLGIFIPKRRKKNA